MARGKRRKPSNKNEDYMASSEPNSPTKENTEYPNTPEKQDLDLKSYLIMRLEDFKKDMKNSLRETQENINKQVEAYREESQKSLKEFQENIIKQLKELKMGIEAMKKEHRETTLDIENQRKRQGAVDTRITNRIQDIEERISGGEDSIEIINTTVKDNVKWKKLLIQGLNEKIKPKDNRYRRENHRRSFFSGPIYLEFCRLLVCSWASLSLGYGSVLL